MVAPLPVRATDPATSQEAARSTHMQRQQRDVLVILAEQRQGTKWTIAAGMYGVESGTVASRLSQLEAMGLAVKVGTTSGERGRTVSVWEPTVAGRAAVAGGVLPDRAPRGCVSCGESPCVTRTACLEREGEL